MKRFCLHIRLLTYTVMLMLCVQIAVAQKEVYPKKRDIYQENSSKSNSVSKYQTISYLDMYLDSARYLSKKSPMRAVEFINKAIEESISNNNKQGEAEALLILGDIQQYLGQQDLALESYKKSIKALSSNKKSKRLMDSPSNGALLFTAYKQAANSLLAQEQLEEASTYINYGINYYASNTSDKNVQEAKRLLAEIYLKQGKAPKSREVLNEVLSSEQSNKNPNGEIQTLLNLGKTYQKENDGDKAINFYTKAKDLSEKLKLTDLTIQANSLLATVYRAQKQVDKEVQARNSNIALNISTNNSIANPKENVEIGNAYLNVSNVDQAVNYYDMSTQQQQVLYSTNAAISSEAIKQQELFSVSNDLDESANAYKTLAEEYVKRKEFDKATIYFKKYANMQDSIKQIRSKELDEAIAISTRIGKNQQRIDLLEKERELNAKSIEILEQDKSLKEDEIGLRNTIIISLSVIVALMLLAVFLIVRSSREKKKIHQLLALKSLRGQMNPHFIFNALNSVNHYVSQNDERQANRYLSDFSRLMRLVMDSSKHDFIGLGEELEMLRLYLQLEHARFEDKFDYEIIVPKSLEDGELEIPPMLIQPYLENAVWHGLRYLDGKGKLTLELERSGTELCVTIIDNGIGRERSKELKTQNQKKQTSLGMQNIVNRVGIMNELFHSNIGVTISEAFPGQTYCGTKVKLIIPQKLNTHA